MTSKYNYLYKFNSAILLKTVAAIGVIFLLYSSLTFTKHKDSINFMDNFSCKAKLSVKRKENSFAGIIDINVIKGKGTLRIDGIVHNTRPSSYIVQRTVIFDAEKENSRPTWKSKKIITTHLDDVSNEVLVTLFPAFYTTSATVTNIDLETLSDGTLVITKSHLPYLYCSGL